MVFVTTYTDGQWELLQTALEELEALARKGLEEDTGEVDGSETDVTAFVAMMCLSV